MSVIEPDENEEDRPEPRKRIRKPQPIRVSKRQRHCDHCKDSASIELFRDGKCLACQVAEFIGPL